jgi:hypothetical protein
MNMGKMGGKGSRKRKRPKDPNAPKRALWVINLPFLALLAVKLMQYAGFPLPLVTDEWIWCTFVV